MKRILLGLFLTMSICHRVYGATLIDIEEHWAKEEIEKALQNGIVKGYEDQTFKPDSQVTLAEFLKILISSSSLYITIANNKVYPDSYIKTAEVNGLILEGELKEDNHSLTRYEASQIMGRYIRLEDVTSSKKSLKDVEDPCGEVIQKLYKLGVISGYEDKTFRGHNPVSRAEAIIMIQRANTVKKEKVLQRSYPFEDSLVYTNYEGHAEIGTLFDNVSYKVQGGKLYLTDKGRYGNFENFQIKSDLFDVTKTIKVIQNLVNEEGYVGVYYFPSEEFVSQFVISYGKNEKRVSNNTNELNIVYYPDKYYPLKDSSRIDLFSNQCYMKISIVHLWQELSDFENGIYVDSYLKERLQKGLEGEFGKTYAQQIMEYIAEKITETFSKEDNYDTEIGQKAFGRYQIDYYKASQGLPEFYISRK